MSAVIIEELDSSSESGFATPKSDRSADDFHEAFCEVLDEQGSCFYNFVSSLACARSAFYAVN